MPIDLYKGKIENNVTDDAYNYFCRAVPKLTKLLVLDLRTVLQGHSEFDRSGPRKLQRLHR